MGADGFVIDLDDLDAVIGDVQACEDELEAIIGDLDRRMATLHDTWEGDAATAHTAAHQEMARGMRAMRQALVDLRAAARSAHGNYTAAGETNLSMWEAMR